MIQFFRQMPGKLGSTIYAGIQGQTNPQHLAFMRQLQKEMKQSNSLELPLADLKVVVFDLETTGFHPEKGDQVISIGAVKMIGNHIEHDQTYYSLIKTSTPLSPEITRLTNIQNEELSLAPEGYEVLVRFLKFIGSHILVAHHAKHEQAFMQKMTYDLLRAKFEHRILDTSFFIQLSNPLLKLKPLEDLCPHFNIEVKDRHHALADAKVTAQVWRNLLIKAEQLQLKNLREVYEYIAKIR